MEGIEKAKGKDDPTLAPVLNGLGGLYILAGKPERAEPLFQRALSLLEKKNGAESVELLPALNYLSNYYYIKPDLDNAGKYATRALAISTKAWGNTDVREQPCLKILCKIYVSQQHTTDALPLLLRLVAVTKTLLGETSSELIWPLQQLGDIYLKQRYLDVAIDKFEKALKIQVTNMPLPTGDNAATPDQLKTAYLEFATAENKLGALYLAKKDASSAEKLFLQALGIRRSNEGDTSADAAEVASNLGDTYLMLQDFKDALAYYQAALSIRTKLNPQSKETAAAMCSLGQLYFAQKDYASAAKMYNNALFIDKSILNGDDPQLASVLTGLAIIDLEQDKLDDAEPLFQQAKGILEQDPDAHAGYLILCLENYARLLEKQDKREESVALLTRVRELREKQAPVDKPEDDGDR